MDKNSDRSCETNTNTWTYGPPYQGGSPSNRHQRAMVNTKRMELGVILGPEISDMKEDEIQQFRMVSPKEPADRAPPVLLSAGGSFQLLREIMRDSRHLAVAASGWPGH